MDIDIKKNGKVRVLDTPYFKPITQTNISFSNMDIGTAKITFRLLKNSLPLQVSEKNVDVYCYLESSNGSSIEVPLHFEDPLNGIVSMTIDKDFLEASTNSTVEGQLYITMNKKNKTYNDYSNTVALQKFSFAVEDALINKISGSDKIFYIRSFDILKSEIKNKIYEMEQDIGKIEEVKKELERLFYEIKEEINQIRKDTINQLQSEYTEYSDLLNDIHNQALTDIDNRTKVSLNQIDNRKEEILKLLEEGEIVTKTMFEGYKSDIKDQLDEVLLKNQNEIKSYKEELQTTIDNLNWQKHKLTSDDGNIISVTDTVDMNTLSRLDKTGFYYCANLTNTPDGKSNQGYINLYNQSESAGYAIYRDYNSSDLYINMKYNSEWNGWELLNPDHTVNLDWQKYRLVDDDGSQIGNFNSNFRMTSENLLSTPPGFYYNYEYNDAPSGATGFVYITENASGDKKIYYSSYKYNDLYIKTYTKSIGWVEWEKVGGNYTDTGWKDLPLINGIQEYSSSYTPQFRLIELNDMIIFSLRGAIKNVTSSRQMFAQVPPYILNKLAPPHPYVQTGSIKNGSATLVRFSVEKSGDIGIIGVSNPNDMSASDFYPIDTTIVV